MFSQACVILFTMGLMATRSLFVLVSYSVGTHPTGMLACRVIPWFIRKSKQFNVYDVAALIMTVSVNGTLHGVICIPRIKASAAGE